MVNEILEIGCGGTSVGQNKEYSWLAFFLDPTSQANVHKYYFRSLYFGVGRGLGGLLGAYLWEAIGAVYTFRLFGAISASVAIFYTIAAFILRARKSPEVQTAEGGKF